MLSKIEVRDYIKNKLNLISPNMIEVYSEQLLRNILQLVSKCSNIAIYNAYGKEISLDYVINYCLENKINLYQPVAFKNNRLMQLARYASIKKDIFSDQTVIIESGYAWYNLDMIILPLMAADKNGYRIGKGGGYYDATLAQYDLTNITLCGVGYDFQYMMEDFLFDSWDIQLDYFVSPNKLIKF